MSLANTIIDKEVRRCALVDKVEVGNRCNSNIDRNSVIESFKEAKLDAAEEQIGVTEVEDMAKEDRDMTLGAPENQSLLRKPDGQSRQRKADQGNPLFNEIDSINWNDYCHQLQFTNRRCLQHELPIGITVVKKE